MSQARSGARVDTMSLLNLKQLACRMARLGVMTVATTLFVGGMSVSAQAQSCEQLFKSVAATVRADVPVAAQAIIDRQFDGISERGFLANKPAPEPALTKALNDRGIIWWYLRVFVARDLASAKAHAALENDVLMQGVYLIDPKASANIIARPAPSESAPDTFSRLMTVDAMYEIKAVRNAEGEVTKDAEGGVIQTVTKVSPELIKKTLKVDELTWDLDDPEHGPYIKQTGWAFPRVRGIIPSQGTEGSKNYKRARTLAKQLIAKGFRITFDKDFTRALTMVAEQTRLIEGQWVANSLYKDPDNFNMTMDSFREGKAFSVEVWNEKGEMVGGLIGLKDGSIYAPESTFYDHVRYPEISIGFAKIGIVALMDRLKAAGIPFADAGMVTPFTKSMRGELIPGADFLRLRAQIPQEAKVDFSTDWTP